MLYTKKQAEPPYALRGFLPVVKVNNKLCMHVDIPHVCTSCQASTRETTPNDESGGTVCLRARKQALERAQVVRLACGQGRAVMCLPTNATRALRVFSSANL